MPSSGSRWRSRSWRSHRSSPRASRCIIPARADGRPRHAPMAGRGRDGAPRRGRLDFCRGRAGRFRRRSGSLLGGCGGRDDHDVRGARMAEAPVSAGCRHGRLIANNARGDMGRDMRFTKLTRRLDRPLRTCAAGIALLAVLTGCGRGDAKSSKQAPSAPTQTVIVAEVAQRSVGVGADFVARTEAVPTVELRARVSGVLEQVRFREGSEVKKGQTLFVIQQDEYKASLQSAKAQLAKAEADLVRAKDTSIVDRAKASLEQAKADVGKDRADVARFRPLVEQQAIPKQDLDTAISREQASAAGVQAAEAALKDAILAQRTAIQLSEAAVESGKAAVTQANLNVDYTTVESPINGIISKLNVDTGNLVGKGEPTLLATVSAIDPMYVDFAITEADYLRFVKRIPGLGRGEVPRDRAPALELILADGSVF